MKISYRWLQSYVKTALTPEELAEKFRLTSSEVDGILDLRGSWEGLTVGEVLSVVKHPNADKLRIAEVSLGRERRTIVCGAPNLEIGQRVVVATPGTVLHPSKGEAFTIQSTTIRGQKSDGMLCAADEIGLPLGGLGILELPATAMPGQAFSSAFDLEDAILDLEITPNRPDLLGYLGLAREVAAFDKKSLLEPAITPFTEQSGRYPLSLEVSVEENSACPRYSAICLENIKIGPSPLWLQLRLGLSGITPINNVVDVTNYVMLELGQPLHAFDFTAVPGHPAKKQLAVRKIRAKRQLEVLDNTVRETAGEDILITEAESGQSLAFAGLIGGTASAIKPTTTSIILESATFNGPQIRRTSRRLGLRTEASSRFEKGLDPEITVKALKRAVLLLQENSGATIASKLVDVYPKSRQERPRIHLSFATIQQVTGVHISAAECKSILQRLGFQVPTLNKSSFEAIPPSWRKDVSIPEDIIEELIRIWGFERLPSTLPTGQVKAPQPNRSFERKKAVRHALAGAGLHECIHLSFVSTAMLEKVGLTPADAIALQYPLSAETEYLAPTHLIAHLNNVATVNAQRPELGLFEIGRVFYPPKQEKEMLSVLMRTGEDAGQLFRSLKSVVNHAVAGLSVGQIVWNLSENAAPYYAPGTALTLTCGGKEIGTAGQVAESAVQNHKIRSAKTMVFCEIDLGALVSLAAVHSPYQPLPQFPSIERDLTLTVDTGVQAGDVTKAVEGSLNAALVHSWTMPTIYAGKPLVANQKSITLHFVYNAGTRTLEDKEVNADQQRLSTVLRERLAATITE